jgi:hypothetical protein
VLCLEDVALAQLVERIEFDPATVKAGCITGSA